MAAATYTTDLTTYNDCTTITGWIELTGMALSAPPDIDTDLAIHGSICITSDRAKVGLSSNAYVGAGFTLAAGEAIFVWHKFFAPNSLATLANGGVRVMIGDSGTVYDGWYMEGAETYPYGGWVNHVVDPTTTPDQSAGTTTGTYAMVGNGWNLPTQAPSKGNPFGTDIIRYGRGESLFELGDLANGYATFLGYSLVNDNPTTGRFGLIQAVAGGYLYKGLMTLGTATNAVEMVDSNVNINIDDTTKVLSSFNRIEVNNAASIIDWTAVNFTSLGTGSRGEFEMIDNCSVTKDTCVFTDMSTFVYQSSASIDNSTYRRTDLVTSGTASFDSCTFEESFAASSSLSSDLTDFNNCSFISNGSNHGVELNSIGGGSMNWDNYLESYVAGTAASPVTPTSTGNEAIYVNVATGTLTINVGSGYTIPSIRSAGATVNVVSGQVTTTLTVTTRLGVPISGSRVYMEADAGGPITDGTIIFNEITNASGQVTDTRSLASPQPVVGRVRQGTTSPFYSTSPFSGTISNTAGLNLTILMISDE